MKFAEGREHYFLTLIYVHVNAKFISFLLRPSTFKSGIVNT